MSLAVTGSCARCLLALRGFFAVLVATIALLFGVAASADPPGRVGRLAEVGGQVWILDSESGEWLGAEQNRPITTGDRLSIDDESRAEVRIGSSVVRIGAGSDVEFVQLDDDAIRVRIYEGRLAARVRTDEAARELQLLTEEGRFEPSGPGHYRIDRRNATSAATVWVGTLRFTADDSQLDVHAVRRNEFWRDGGRTHYSVLEPARDAFGEWVLAEDRRDDRYAAPRYVSTEMTGVEDLARHGYWQDSAEYGSLWVPHTVVAGWAPYRHGRWTWIAPWGWTWIDDAPWGFAPFHYGRWVWHRQRWCWAPGAYVARPVYAPALVAWVGGPRAGVSVHAGTGPRVGWFPLAPREVYVPPYRASHHHIRNVNVTHAPHIDPHAITQPARAARHARYANRAAPDAVTVVPAHVLERRQPVGRFVDPRVARQAAREPVSVIAPIAPPAPPMRAAVPGGPRVAPVATPGLRPIDPGIRRLPDDGRPGPTVPSALPRERAGPPADSPRAAIPHPAPSIATPQPVPRGFSRDDRDERRSPEVDRWRGRGGDGPHDRFGVPHPPSMTAPVIPQAPAAPPRVQRIPRVAQPSVAPPPQQTMAAPSHRPMAAPVQPMVSPRAQPVIPPSRVEQMPMYRGSQHSGGMEPQQRGGGPQHGGREFQHGRGGSGPDRNR